MKRSFILKRLFAKAEPKKEVKKKITNPSAKVVQSIDKDSMITSYNSMAEAGRSLLTTKELELPRLEMGKIASKLSKEVSKAVKSKESFMDLSWSKAD